MSKGLSQSDRDRIDGREWAQEVLADVDLSRSEDFRVGFDETMRQRYIAQDIDRSRRVGAEQEGKS